MDLGVKELGRGTYEEDFSYAGDRLCFEKASWAAPRTDERDYNADPSGVQVLDSAELWNCECRTAARREEKPIDLAHCRRDEISCDSVEIVEMRDLTMRLLDRRDVGKAKRVTFQILGVASYCKELGYARLFAE